MFSFIEVHIWTTIFTDLYWPTYCPRVKIIVLHIIIGCVNVVLKNVTSWVPCPCKVFTRQSQSKTLQYTRYNTESWLVIYLWKSSSLLSWIQRPVFSKMKKILTKEAGIDVFMCLDHLSYRTTNYFNYTKFVHAVLNATI